MNDMEEKDFIAELLAIAFVTIFMIVASFVAEALNNTIGPRGSQSSYSDYAKAYVEEINAKELDFDTVTPEDLGMIATDSKVDRYRCPTVGDYLQNTFCTIEKNENSIRISTLGMYAGKMKAFEFSRSEGNKLVASGVWY